MPFMQVDTIAAIENKECRAKTSMKWLGNNCGTATVELCLVMPIVLFVVAFSIGLFINSLKAADIWGDTYAKLYSYHGSDISPNGTANKISDFLEDIDSITLINVNSTSGTIELKYTLTHSDRQKSDMYGIEEYDFSREYDKCTSRLRRWQLYGDILQE